MSTLDTLLPSGTVRLLTHFLLDPEARLHVRALHRRTGLGMGALQRELARLEGLGLVRRSEEGRRVTYEMQYRHPSWNALLTLFREHADPADVIREAIQELPGIHAAFVFGSTARGAASPESDIDLLMVDDETAPLSALGRAVMRSESLLGRPLDLKRYTPASLPQAIRDDFGFLGRVLAGPKSWVRGSEADLQPLMEPARTLSSVDHVCRR